MKKGEESMEASADPFAELAQEEEVRILPPDFALKKLIGEEVDLKQIFSAENIEKAQQVINDHQGSFREWVMNDIETLKQSFAKASADPEEAEAEIKKVARTAFVIKSQAGMFGFTLGTQVAKSLDDFCNQHFRNTPEHMTVVEKHIDTLVTIFSENIAGDGAATGKKLSESLNKLIDKYK